MIKAEQCSRLIFRLSNYVAMMTYGLVELRHRSSIKLSSHHAISPPVDGIILSLAEFGAVIEKVIRAFRYAGKRKNPFPLSVTCLPPEFLLDIED